MIIWIGLGPLSNKQMNLSSYSSGILLRILVLGQGKEHDGRASKGQCPVDKIW